MATDIVGSLFGMTPEQLQIARDNQLREQAMAYTKLTPEQKVSYGAALGGQQLGNALGGLMGAEDPQMKMSILRSNVMKQVDPTNIESMTRGIQQLQSGGDTVGALNLTNILRGLQKTQAETIKAKREGLTNEQRNAAGLADSLYSRGTPEWTSTYSKELARLTSKESPKGQTKVVGVAVGTQTPVYEDPNTDQQYIYVIGKDGKQIRQPYAGAVDRTTAKVTATAESKGEVKGAEKIAELDANRLDKARTLADTVTQQADVLNQLLKTPQPIAGVGVPARQAAYRFFQTIGLASPADEKKLQNADTFNSLAGERVLSFIKTLGVNPTDTDREFARSIGPALEKGEKTNRDLISYLLGRANQVVKNVDAMEKHYYDNNYSLRGFKSLLRSNLNMPSQLSTMSTEELLKIANPEKK